MDSRHLDLSTIIAIQASLQDVMNAYVIQTEEKFFDCRDKEIFSEAAKWQNAVWEVSHLRHQVLVALSEMWDESFAEVKVGATKIDSQPVLPEIPAQNKTLTLRVVK